MANAIGSLSNFDGNLKQIFGSLQDVIPESMVLQNRFPFEAAEMVGKFFTEPYIVQLPSALTLLGPNGSGAAGDFALVGATSMITTPAEVPATRMVLRTIVGGVALDRASGGSKSFKKGAALNTQALRNSMRNFVELLILCGQSGFAVVESWDDATNTATITAASVRAGWLSQLVGKKIDAVDATTYVPKAQSTYPNGMNVTSVDVAARTITIALEPDNDPAAGDLLFLHDGSQTTTSFMEMAGLEKQIGLQSGSLFNLSRTTYPILRGSVNSSFGPMTSGSLLALVAQAKSKGLSGKALAIMSNKAWAALNDRALSQQVFDSSYKPGKAQMGTDSIEIRGQGIVVECIGHEYAADGTVIVVQADKVSRLGSGFGTSANGGEGSDISFEISGSEGGVKYCLPVLNADAVEFQCKTDQQVYLRNPGAAAMGTGVTY